MISRSAATDERPSVERSLAYRLLRYVWRRTDPRLRDAVLVAAGIARNAPTRWLGRPDYRRWASPSGLDGWWNERTMMLAGLVPAGSRVIEFGAGRRQLETFLPAACRYTPSDLVDRGAGTIVCDLNRRPLPDLSRVAPEVAVFGGVLEYVRDVPALLRWLAGAGVTTCVASFDVVPQGLGIIGQLRESARRSYNGYVTDLREAQLLRAFETAGFTCTERRTCTMPNPRWSSQIILQFRRQPRAAERA